MSAQGDAKAALFAACQTLFPQPILVTYGPAGTYLADDTIELLATRADETVATMSPLRRREVLVELDGRISCYRGGGVEVQQAVTELAYGYLDSLSAYLQDSGTVASTQVTLGGVVREARVVRSEMTEEEDSELIAEGRTTTLTFTVQATVRV